MELRRYVQLLRERIALLGLALALGLAVGYLSSNRTATYRAESSIYVGSRQFAAISDTTNASAAMDRLIQTFAAMIKSNPVATAAIQLSNAPRTASEVVAATEAGPIPNTNYIVVAVTDTNPSVAQSLANGVAQGFVGQVQKLEPGTAAGGGSPGVTSVFQQAVLPTAPLPTSTKRNLLLGGLFGLGAGIALVALVNYLDISVKTSESVERAMDLPVLGIIPFLPSAATAAMHPVGVPKPSAAPPAA